MGKGTFFSIFLVITAIAFVNYCYTNESSLVQNNSKNEGATKEEPKQKAMREEMVNERNRSVCVCMEGDI